MVIVGVDPAFRKGGFWACFLDLSDRTAAFRSFRDVLEYDRFIRSEEAPATAYVVVENSNLQNQNFDMTGQRDELARKGRNVGTNQAVSELTVRASIDRYGKESVLNLSPKQKGAKYDERYFFAALKGDRVTPIGYTGNQDQRDAYKLAHIGVSELRLKRARVY
jgi:hypothetical protein